MQVPQGDVEPGHALGDGPGFGGLDRQHLGLRGQREVSHLGGGESLADEERGEHRVDEPRAMLGAHRREVAPDLAPAFGAFSVGDADEDRRAVAHDAEGGLHGGVNGGAKNEGFDVGEFQGHGPV